MDNDTTLTEHERADLMKFAVGSNLERQRRAHDRKRYLEIAFTSHPEDLGVTAAELKAIAANLDNIDVLNGELSNAVGKLRDGVDDVLFPRRPGWEPQPRSYSARGQTTAPNSHRARTQFSNRRRRNS